jgi:predicted alpha/beta hydrolase family esterase
MLPKPQGIPGVWSIDMSMAKFQNAFIFHGTAGSPEGNWFPWLKTKLENQDIVTTVPRFPTPEGESLDAWLKVLKSQAQQINSASLLIGHSKGGMFLLKVLEQLVEPVDTAVFVSAPIGVKPIRYYEEDKLFSNFEFDWDKIRSKAKHFVVVHSDNDPYVSIENGRQLAKELGIDLTFIPQAGHINSESGFTEFPQILKSLGFDI